MKTQTIPSQIMRISFLLFLFCFSIAKAQIVNIPDANFKNFLLTNYALNSDYNQIPIDMNGDNEIQYSEALNIYSMPTIQVSITSFVGLEAFQNLRYLTIYWSTATTLDLSNLINLQSVELKWNANLSNLNVNGLTYLTYLTCNNNAISALDLSTNSSLNTVFCDNNNISNINFGTQNSLINLQCDSNQISTLDVSNLINLKYLKCSWNQISSLAIANLILLEELNCSTNLISSLDLSNLVNLKKLHCENNQLSAISLNSLSLLNDFNCEHNQLTSLDLMNNNNLVTLYCSGNLFTNLNVSTLTNLHTLVADSCPITTLDVSNLTSLTNLYIGGVQLQTLFMKNGSNENLYLFYSPNLQYICADATEIPAALTTVANNASTSTVVNTYCSFTPGGVYNTIAGHIIFDGNNNGCDANDPVLPKV
jgi:Leucine-rich repeat (LRR) protein